MTKERLCDKLFSFLSACLVLHLISSSFPSALTSYTIDLAKHSGHKGFHPWAGSAFRSHICFWFCALHWLWEGSDGKYKFVLSVALFSLPLPQVCLRLTRTKPGKEKGMSLLPFPSVKLATWVGVSERAACDNSSPRLQIARMRKQGVENLY